MPFTIPDNDEAFNANQAIWMQTDIDAVVTGVAGDGVVSGCAVTAQGTPDMTVAVAAGEIRIGNLNIGVAAGNGTIATADATNPRIDLVSINSSGAIVVTAGTAAAQPKAPALPASSALLAMVYVPAGDTAIQSNQIIDKRVVRPRLIPAARAKTGSSNGYLLPGVIATGFGTSNYFTNRLVYFPHVVLAPLTIDALAVRVSGFNDAGNTARLGIYRATQDWQPSGAPLVDVEVSTATTGNQIGSFSAVTIQPGIYLSVFHPNDLIALEISYGSPITGTLINSNFGNDRYTVVMQIDRASYGALPTPGIAWDTLGVEATSSFFYGVYWRVTGVG